MTVEGRREKQKKQRKDGEGDKGKGGKGKEREGGRPIPISCGYTTQPGYEVTASYPPPPQPRRTL